MHITTVHTLSFTTVCQSSEQYNTAMTIIKLASEQRDVKHSVDQAPLSPDAASGSRTSHIKVSSADLATCENFYTDVSNALSLIGVGVSFP